MKMKLLMLAIIPLLCFHAEAQTRTMGIFLNDTTNSFNGYTLFAPKQNTMTYLINNEGRKINQWTACAYPPGQSVYLLENGHLLRTCMTTSQLGTGGGEGGRIELPRKDLCFPTMWLKSSQPTRPAAPLSGNGMSGIT